jgi:hypothetical protein
MRRSRRDDPRSADPGVCSADFSPSHRAPLRLLAKRYDAVQAAAIVPCRRDELTTAQESLA